MTVKMTRSRSERIMSVLKDYYGETEPDLVYKNLYQLAVAVILSAQTTDRQVNGVTGNLFKKYPGFASLGNAEAEDVEGIIKSTGFYHNKARNIILMSRIVAEKYGGTLPDNLEELIKLPGIGRKTANVIISIGFGKPGLAVDTHVSRIAHRLGYSQGKSPLEIEMDLCSVIPPGEWRSAHLLFIRHGRSLCKARSPECTVCPLSRFCRYFKSATQG